jgi:hypothetical protein
LVGSCAVPNQVVVDIGELKRTAQPCSISAGPWAALDGELLTRRLERAEGGREEPDTRWNRAR